tara:strand:+ start:2822 stop:3163 length:342 start_codon:yes stop_codon:yes gene_type:complete
MNDDKPALELAHEVNKELLELILYRQQRKFWLSAGLISIKLCIVIGIMLMVTFQRTLDDSWKEVLLVILGFFAGAISKVSDFWFNNASDDNQLISSATSYKMNGSPVEESEDE